LTELLTTDDLAAIMHAPPDTLRHWRLTGYGPRGVRIGRRILYRASDVEAWLDRAFAE
jgi:hypothetical protein